MYTLFISVLNHFKYEVLTKKRDYNCSKKVAIQYNEIIKYTIKINLNLCKLLVLSLIMTIIFIIISYERKVFKLQNSIKSLELSLK